MRPHQNHFIEPLCVSVCCAMISKEKGTLNLLGTQGDTGCIGVMRGKEGNARSRGSPGEVKPSVKFYFDMSSTMPCQHPRPWTHGVLGKARSLYGPGSGSEDCSFLLNFYNWTLPEIVLLQRPSKETNQHLLYCIYRHNEVPGVELLEKHSPHTPLTQTLLSLCYLFISSLFLVMEDWTRNYINIVLMEETLKIVFKMLVQCHHLSTFPSSAIILRRWEN